MYLECVCVPAMQARRSVRVCVCVCESLYSNSHTHPRIDTHTPTYLHCKHTHTFKTHSLNTGINLFFMLTNASNNMQIMHQVKHFYMLEIQEHCLPSKNRENVLVNIDSVRSFVRSFVHSFIISAGKSHVTQITVVD